jgi:uncharacterized BrkB/YihY/UPF0761 family membrane protein
MSALTERSREMLAASQARLAALLEKHHNRPVIDLGLRIYQRDREAAGTVVGSAIAFRLFLFFVPLLLAVVGIAGFLASLISPEDIEDANITGSLAVQMQTALTQPDSTRWIAVLAGLFGMGWAGRSLSRVLVAASCLAWQQPMRIKASPRLVGAIIGLLFCVGLVSLLVNQLRAELGLAIAGLSFIVAFGVYLVAWLLMSMLLPRATRDPSALLPGAALMALVLAGLQAISQLYLPDRFDRASQLYGAIGTTVVTLGWFFIIGRSVMLAMSINAVVYERFGSISQFVFSLPLLRALPRRWEWFRRFFQLGPPDG